jgi:hypothetical protein
MIAKIVGFAIVAVVVALGAMLVVAQYPEIILYLILLAYGSPFLAFLSLFINNDRS